MHVSDRMVTAQLTPFESGTSFGRHSRVFRDLCVSYSRLERLFATRRQRFDSGDRCDSAPARRCRLLPDGAANKVNPRAVPILDRARSYSRRR